MVALNVIADEDPDGSRGFHRKPPDSFPQTARALLLNLNRPTNTTDVCFMGQVFYFYISRYVFLNYIGNRTLNDLLFLAYYFLFSPPAPL